MPPLLVTHSIKKVRHSCAGDSKLQPEQQHGTCVAVPLRKTLWINAFSSVARLVTKILCVSCIGNFSISVSVSCSM